MNIGKALLVKSGFNHVQSSNSRPEINNLWNRLQWSITYKGTYHEDTVYLSKQYTDYINIYMKGSK